MIEAKNFFENIPQVNDGEEIIEVISESPELIIERIISNNCISPKTGWYEQNNDEWVMLIQGNAKILFEDKEIELYRGDNLYIPAKTKHKVSYTSSIPICIWLAIHTKTNK